MLFGAASLGLLLGGIGIGQALYSGSIDNITRTKVGFLEENAKVIMGDYTDSLKPAATAQVQQSALETSVRLQYIQVRQNAEIIRLLGEIAKK